MAAVEYKNVLLQKREESREIHRVRISVRIVF
jgi:hypothetical protein